MNQTLPPDLLATINRELDVLPPELLALPLKTSAEPILLHTALFHKIFVYWPDTFYAFLDLFHTLLRTTYGHGYYGKASHYLFFHVLGESAFEPIVQTFRVYDDALWQRLTPPSNTLNQGGTVPRGHRSANDGLQSRSLSRSSARHRTGDDPANGRGT